MLSLYLKLNSCLHFVVVLDIFVYCRWKLFCERKKQRRIYKNSAPLSPWLPMLMNAAYVTSGATSPFTVYKKHCSVSRLAGIVPFGFRFCIFN